MAERFSYQESMSFEQQAIVARLENLWGSVEDATAKSFPHMSEDDLPYNYQQDYKTIKHEMLEIIKKMKSDRNYIPSEETTLNDIRMQVLEFLERDESKKY